MPELVQFGDLTADHFARSPVWASCHSFDYDEPWYDETNEETFRPWTGALPASSDDGMYLVRAAFTLADGTHFVGFLTPAPATERAPEAFGTAQPQLFLPTGERVGFWLGMFGDPGASASGLYSALGKPAEAVFPIGFSVSPSLASGFVAGELNGFYTQPDWHTVAVAR